MALRLPLTAKVTKSHLRGEVHVGLYPLLDGGRCWWLAADFDKEEALFDAFMYVKAGRALQVPVALEVSRSGVGAHAWVFFTSPVPAETARRLGTGLLREAMSLRGRMSLASYDRLFPSQDLLPAGGVGNLIAAPLFRPARDKGATLFLDTEILEPYKDQWAYLSTLGRMSPQEVRRAAYKAGKVAVAAEATRLVSPGSTGIRQQSPEVLRARLGAGIRVEQAELTSGLAATLRHAASMHNPLFYERQRMRASTWNIPRFLYSYDEALNGGLILPRGMLDTATSLAAQADSRLDHVHRGDSKQSHDHHEASATACRCPDNSVIHMYLGPVRHTIASPREAADGVGMIPGSAPGGRPAPLLHLHRTRYCYSGDASPRTAGWMSVIYKDLIADDERTSQVTADMATALAQGRNCLVLTTWTTHLDKIANALRKLGHDPVVLRGGMGARQRAAALARLQPQPGGPPLLAIATGSYAGEGFDCPPLDTLFPAAPVAQKGSLLQYARPDPLPLRGEGHRRGPLLRRAHRRPRLVPRQARTRLHQPRLPRPTQAPVHPKRQHSAPAPREQLQG